MVWRIFADKFKGSLLIWQVSAISYLRIFAKTKQLSLRKGFPVWPNDVNLTLAQPFAKNSYYCSSVWPIMLFFKKKLGHNRKTTELRSVFLFTKE